MEEKVKNLLEMVKNGEKTIENCEKELFDLINTEILDPIVSAIYFNDSSDYLKALYHVIYNIKGRDSEIDINKLFNYLKNEK